MGNILLHIKILKTCLSIGLVITFSFFTTVPIKAQTYTIKGIVSDKAEQSVRVPDVMIYAKSNPDKYVRSNTKGEYSLTFDVIDSDTIVFKHIGYETLTKIITPKSLKSYPNKIITYNPFLNSVTLTEYTFRHQKVDTVFGNFDYSVQDYFLFPKKNMLLLVYNKTFEKGTELWFTDSTQNKISTYSIPYQSKQLFTDYGGNNYLICNQ